MAAVKDDLSRYLGETERGEIVNTRHGKPAGPTSPAQFSIGHIVKSKQEVDALMKQAEKAGAKVNDPAHDRFWGGYSGYFQDLDGHLWEIAWNPQWEVTE